MKVTIENECCGSGPHTGTEVRTLPIGAGGNLILCHSCFARELAWRHARNLELPKDARYKLPAWSSLETYAT